MSFEELKADIQARARQYSINSEAHKVFIEEASGFREGVDWTLLKLLQLGYLRIETNDTSEGGVWGCEKKS